MRFRLDSNMLKSTTVEKIDWMLQNIVLRHLNVLLGYNQTEKAFSVPPYKLRCSAVFNAYISILPAVSHHSDSGAGSEPPL